MENENHFESRDSYETGSTRPPKNRSGLVVFLLVLIILLFGISSFLGAMNIRLFPGGTDDGKNPLAFSPSDQTAGTDENPPDNSQNANTGDLTLDLQPAPGQVDNIPQTGGLSLQEIYARNIPSVVSISCTLPSGKSSGTGVVLSKDGYVVTNCHVIDGAAAISLRLTDGRVLSAQIVGSDPVSDLAVLSVQATDLTPAVFGTSSDLRVGDAVVAIGDPLGEEYRGTMTDGIISAINREVKVGSRTMTLIQTNAALNSGNSGGPLINCHGQVIGINTMKISAFANCTGVEGLGFAIPSGTVKEIVDQLVAQGYVSGRPDPGISGEDVPELYQRYYRLPAGFFITEVKSGSAAEETALSPGCIITHVGGIRVQSAEAFYEALYAYNAGDAVTLTVYRQNKTANITLTLGEAGE